MGHILYVCFTTVLLLMLLEAAKVSETDCVKAQPDQCTGIDNAECDNADADAKCKCSDGYIEAPGDGITCTKVLGSTCSGSAVCDGATNSVCDGNKCVCKQGYGEKNDVCTKILGSTCSGSAVCDGATNSVCDGNKCVCKQGYGEKNDVCTKTVTSTDCNTDAEPCPGIDNSVCDSTKCKCIDSYVEDVDTCKQDEKGNSACSFVFWGNMMFVPLLSTLHLIIF